MVAKFHLHLVSRCGQGLVSVDASTDTSPTGGKAHLLAELVNTSSASRCACPPCWLLSVDASTDTSPTGGQAHLLAELVNTSMWGRQTGLPYTSSASRCACPPCWCTPARRAGVPARHAGVHQLGEQVCLPDMLVFTSSASRCACPTCWCSPARRAGVPARHAGVHQLGEQVCLPAHWPGVRRRVYGQQPLAAPARWLVSVDASTDISPWPHMLAMLV
ncbi:hypothetical protein PCASD_03390 [Puccinia coronata f. sp. avenae]|uniref:Uncharacterized protein n=1 Tax=Puccinia coronata f. sp. avenae TaxID=200324 RepID=A0A2N5VFB3_9BASI|nr:hypothetical protein PCASD_03390 [Puccinia coronata f. sp. avenae]